MFWRERWFIDLIRIGLKWRWVIICGCVFFVCRFVVLVGWDCFVICFIRMLIGICGLGFCNW